jgi:hypothetical protein
MMLFIEALRKAVRAICTLAIVGALVYGFLVKLVSAEVFVGIAVLVIKYWFDSDGIEPPKSKEAS